MFLSAAGNWDLNQDGVVTGDKWKQYAGELFDAADTNHDGFVDRTEYATIVSTDRMFQTVEFSYYGANGEGKLSREEFVNKLNREQAKPRLRSARQGQYLPARREPGCRRTRSHRAGVR